MRALLDTCVIVDALQNREPFCKDAQTIFLLSANRQFEGFLTAKAVTDIYYLTHRQTHSDKDTRGILTKLFALFHLLDTSAMDIRNAISAEVSEFLLAFQAMLIYNSIVGRDALYTHATELAFKCHMMAPAMGSS